MNKGLTKIRKQPIEFLKINSLKQTLRKGKLLWYHKNSLKCKQLHQYFFKETA